MRTIRLLGVTFVAVLALSAVAVASASAHEWLINGAALGAAEPSESKGTLLLKDEGTGSKVECKGKFVGTIGPGAGDTIEKVVGPNSGEELWLQCKVIEEGGSLFKCPLSAKAEVMAVNLPWKTELVSSGTEIRDDISNSGAGEPGYEVKCIIGGFPVTDKCTGASSSKETNVAEGVLGVFDSKSPNANCTLGGTSKGQVRGEGVTTSPNGLVEVI